MDFNQINRLIKQNPVITLLRSTRAPLFIFLIQEEYKSNNIIIVEEDQLSYKLALLLNEQNFEIPNSTTVDEYAKSLIDEWSSDRFRLLRRYYDSNGIVIIELTPSGEKTHQLFESLKPKEFIGTESRFNDIFRRLNELTQGSEGDPKKRIAELKEQKNKISQEIKKIEQTGFVETLNEFQIKERIEEIQLSARDLLSDFSQVENNFRELVQDIYRQESSLNGGKGELLGRTLDGYSELLDSPQGKSFQGFWQFLIADSGNDKINKMVKSVYENLEKQEIVVNDYFLLRLKHHLHNAGMKIVDTNHQLAKKLNRILADPHVGEKRRIKSLIGDIRKNVLHNRDKISATTIEMFCDFYPEINLPMERNPIFPISKNKIEEIPSIAKPENIDIATIFSRFALDIRRLESNINTTLLKRERVTLTELIDQFPIKGGLEEILAYLNLAMERQESIINREHEVLLSYQTNNEKKAIRMPEVIFCR